MLKKLAIGLGSAIIIAAIVVCAIPLKTVSYTVNVPYTDVETYYETEPYTECTYRDYAAKGGYTNGWKSDWEIRTSLFDTGGNPVTSGSLKFYIKNYEDRLGSFTVRINFWDTDPSFVEAFDYHTISVGPGETEYGYISYNWLWQNKPGRARSFNVRLDVPQIEECETKYKDVEKQRTVTKYRQETRYESVTILEYLTSYE